MPAVPRPRSLTGWPWSTQKRDNVTGNQPDRSQPTDMLRAVCATLILGGGALMLMAQADQPEARMVRAAAALLPTLDAGQRAKIRWPFDSEERFNWHFVPRDRQGLPLKAMNETQRGAAFELLRAGLSASGYSKAETIRSLENVLLALEGSARRDPEQYYLTIFGDPGSTRWGWRYEGHHISQNWTLVNGEAIATTPAFFGANPAEVRQQVPNGPARGTRALAREEDLARELLASLPDAQLREAVTSEEAPGDIITGNARKAAILENQGLAAERMTPKQQALLMALIEEHASSQPEALAEQRMAKVRSDGLGRIRFAWMGSTRKARGEGHYYRIQGASFLIEYDNVQTDANHQHVVWRDFHADFGADVLGLHHEHDPGHARSRGQ